MNTKLAKLRTGDRIVSITNAQGKAIPAAKISTGVRFPASGDQTLTVASVEVYGKTAVVRFTNGGMLLPCAANTPVKTA